MKKIVKVFSLLIMLSMILSMFTGCYLWKEVESNQVGLKMDNGVTINQVVGSGRYSSGAPFASLVKIDVAAKTIIWEDKDMWTSDKQPVAFSVSITYARKKDADSMKKMWEQFNAEAKNDKALETLVRTRVPRAAKQVTTSMTLDQMLGIADGIDKNGASVDMGRAVLQEDMSKLLKVELEKCGVDLLDVGVNNIGVDEDYAKKLKEKASSKVASEVSQQKTLQLQEQIKQEQAQTLIDLEIASRKNQVQEKENEVYTANPQAFELERLKRLADVIGSNDKIYFVPQGSNINVVLGGNASVASAPATPSDK